MKTSFTHLILGLLIIALGVGFLLDNLSIINFGAFVSGWWPSIIVLVGIIAFIGNPRSVIFPLGAVVIGGLLQLRELDVISFSIGSLIWPVALILVGLSIVFNRIGNWSRETRDETSNHSAVLSGIEAKNKSSNYRGGKITAILGGITLDLREATLKQDSDLDIFTIMGGVELRVPEGWRVHVEGVPLLGGWEDKTTVPNDKKAPVLRIHATCVMGGIEIKN